MKTERQKAIDLIAAIDSVEAVPRSLIRQLRELVTRWRPAVIVGDGSRLGAGSHATLERLCNAAEGYIKSLEDAKSLLEVR